MDVSIVIPVFNEETNVVHLSQKLKTGLSDWKKSYEVIFVDDGSTDGSFKALRALVKKHSFVRILRLRRNFGQTAAIAAGIERAKGKAIVLMDADLQNDPADIPKLVTKLEEGYDVVSGWRRNRKDPLLARRFPSTAANFIISLVTGVRLKDYGCTLKAYRQEVIKNVSLYGEMHRFLPALCAWQGAEIAEVPVSHYPRLFGKSKYGLIRTFKVILDLTTVKFLGSYMTKPLYVFGGLGLLALVVGFGVVTYLIYAKLTKAGFFIITSPLLLLSALLVILGVLFILIGLLAEIAVRIYFESQGKKPYTIRETIGF